MCKSGYKTGVLCFVALLHQVSLCWSISKDKSNACCVAADHATASLASSTTRAHSPEPLSMMKTHKETAASWFPTDSPGSFCTQVSWNSTLMNNEQNQNYNSQLKRSQCASVPVITNSSNSYGCEVPSLNQAMIAMWYSLPPCANIYIVGVSLGLWKAIHMCFLESI